VRAEVHRQRFGVRCHNRIASSYALGKVRESAWP